MSIMSFNTAVDRVASSFPWFDRSQFWIITLGTFIVHEIAFITSNLFYILIAQNNLFTQYKVNENEGTIQEQWAMFRHILKAHFVQLLPIQLLSFPLFLFFGFTTDYATLPSLSKFIAQFLIFNVIEDTGFYWVHRALHIPWLYKRVHARHHEFIKPYSLVGEIAHPVEFLFNFLLPMMIGPFLLGYLQGVHILTFWIWMVFRGARGADAHSGYYLPFHPLRLLSPIYGGALDHDIHHQLRGRKSNYGGYKFWDWICGTQFNPLTTKKQD